MLVSCRCLGCRLWRVVAIARRKYSRNCNGNGIIVSRMQTLKTFKGHGKCIRSLVWPTHAEGTVRTHVRTCNAKVEKGGGGTYCTTRQFVSLEQQLLLATYCAVACRRNSEKKNSKLVKIMYHGCGRVIIFFNDCLFILKTNNCFI